MRWAATALAFATVLETMHARADESGAATADAPRIDLDRDMHAGAATETTAPPLEAPPPAPYRKSVVLDASLGAMAFLGRFGQVAPPGPWLRTQLGYEVLRWLMLFGEGELAFSDTSARDAQPRTRAFAVFGFGAGTRFTARVGDRFGAYGQLSVGMMKADIGRNALGNLGFRDAEVLDTYAGARIGVEWYQVDRHFALGANVGMRLAQGFATTRIGTPDTPLVGDAGISIRYAF